MTASPALDALCHPLVMRAAWLRIDRWYQSGNLAPQPELSRWRLHPEAKLRELGEKLRASCWKPEPWPQIPYPKKGACLRHYVLPTVTDQVAFMAHMVLLGPLLDRRTHSFAFGNRWYRPIVWNRRIATPRWEQRPYPLLTDNTYLPYSRSHGLSRRVAHWTVAHMTRARIEHDDYAGRIRHPDDYAPEVLPKWTRKDWWGEPPPEDDTRAFWVALDIQLAYPSVHLNRVRHNLRSMLSAPHTPRELRSMLRGYPGSVLTHLATPEHVVDIGDGLMDALETVQVENPSGIQRDAWVPWHPLGKLPPEQKDTGLPTGLAISGILLNVALHSADKSILTYLTSHRSNNPGAFIRFADDMYVLSRTRRGLFDLIEAVWCGLAGSERARLASSESQSNLYLNMTKVRPDAVGKIMHAFLEDQDWKKACEDKNGECQDLKPNGKHDPQRFGEWWTLQKDPPRSDDDGKFARLQAALDRSSIGPREVGPFVTTLVARMSDMGQDTLAERFGEGARNRLARLHELARFEIEDEQVRADTRRAFAVNRLVRTWLPQHRSEQALEDIRYSVTHVLRETPWKFSLWRAVIRAAARRPFESSQRQGNKTAAEWLVSQLRLISPFPARHHGEAWLNTWPEENVARGHERQAGWRQLYLSFHRAAFWQALGGVLRTLWRYEDRRANPIAGYSGPSPDEWTMRAIPEGYHKQVILQLGSIDRWTGVLYPEDSLPDLGKWRWELDQFVSAVLASTTRYKLARAWCHAQQSSDDLAIPDGPLWSRIPRTVKLLDRWKRVVCGRVPEVHLGPSELAHVLMAGQDSRLGDFLFPSGGSCRIAGAAKHPRRTVMMAVALGCSDRIGRSLVGHLVGGSGAMSGALSSDPLSLWEYSQARRILLGRPGDGS